MSESLRTPIFPVKFSPDLHPSLLSARLRGLMVYRTRVQHCAVPAWCIARIYEALSQ